MEIKEKREVETTVGYKCDVCKRQSEEVATLYVYWGYFSRKDGVECQCHLCENCYDKVTSFIRNDLKGEVRENNITGWFTT